eukprot:CAMPEP_0177551940 /NCGR_PEP_ID=MMETSP0369-20130122/66489_1 /TAXON_ID=447022 ORGANISM="Scrippsiella hangoei-like, Strain SHHI-4" /NCGR_SAMPLE_ID=MMETSP0369 /ASSEMBLY_ACC=CAM_ASM_000364 /LENGTH=42 /DNA_ID= /DNA_START= /DNA_END= /DNA_ORIENTATION=
MTLGRVFSRPWKAWNTQEASFDVALPLGGRARKSEEVPNRLF